MVQGRRGSGPQGARKVGFCRWALLPVIIAVCVWPISDQQVVRAQEGEWSTPIDISTTPTKSWIPDTAVDGAGNLHVVWGEWLDDDNDWGDAIYYTMWDGKTWSPPNDILVTPNGAVADLPAIAADSQGRLHVVWEGTPGIFYSQAWVQDSPWLSTAWSPPVAISKVGRGRADIAVDSEDNIHIVWIDPPLETPVLDGELCPNCWDVYYTRSSDGGQTWSPPVNLSNSPERPAYPFIAIDGQGVIHAAWDEHNAADQAITGGYSRSLDGGNTWSDPWDVGQDVAPEKLAGLHVSLGEDDRVYLSWRLWHAPGIFMRWSADQGEAWSSIVQLPQVEGLAGYGYLETVSDGAGSLFLAFSVGSNENKEVYLGRWDGGDWLWLQNVSNSPVHSQRPRLAVSEGNNVHMVWFEHTAGQQTIHERGNMEIWYSRLETGAPRLSPQPFPTRLAVAPAPEPTAQATATVQLAPAALPAVALSDTEPASSLDATAVLAIGIGATAAVIGLVAATRLLVNRRGSR